MAGIAQPALSTRKGKKMDELQLEVGQYYLARNGSLVVIIKYNSTRLYPFIGNNGISYMPNGLVYASGSKCDFDLILEWSPEKPTPEAHKQSDRADTLRECAPEVERLADPQPAEPGGYVHT